MKKTETTKRFTEKELIFCSSSLLIPKIYLTYPTGIFDISRSASWIVCLTATAFGFLFFYVSSTLFDRKREITKDFFKNKVKSNTVYALLILMFLANQTVFISAVAESISKSILFEYSPVLISFTFVLVCMAGSLIGLRAIIRANCFFLPFTVFLTLVLVILSVAGFDYKNFFPLFGNGLKMFPQAFLLSSFFGDFVILFLLMPFSEKGVSCKKVFLSSFIISSVLLLVVTLTYVLSVGNTNEQNVFVPVYQIARYIYYKGISIRAESIFAVGWLLIFFTNTSLYIYAISLLTCRVTNFKNIRKVICISSLIIFSGTLFLNNTEKIKEATKYVTFAKVIIEVVSPTVFMLLIKKKKTKTRKIFSAMLSFVLVISLCGCFGAKEVSDMAYIVSVGIDKADSGMYEYTFQSAVPNGKDEKSETPFFTVSKVAPSIYSAVDMLNSEIPKTCDFSHIKMIIFSKDMFVGNNRKETEEILKCDLFYPNTHLVLSKKSAKESLFEIDIPFDTNPAKYYENIFFDDYAKNKIQSKIKNIVKDEKNEASLLVLSVLGDDSESRAVIKNLSLCGFLDSYGVYFLNAFKDKDFSQDLYINDGEKSAVINLSKTEKKVYAKDTDGKIKISVRLCFSGQVRRSSFSSDDEAKRFAESEAKKHLLNLFYTCSKEYNADVFSFSENLKMNYKTTSDWENADFPNRFKDASYDLFVKID